MTDGICPTHEVNVSSDMLSCWKNPEGYTTFAVPLNICKFLLKNDDDKLLAGTSDITRSK